MTNGRVILPVKTKTTHSKGAAMKTCYSPYNSNANSHCPNHTPYNILDWKNNTNQLNCEHKAD